MAQASQAVTKDMTMLNKISIYPNPFSSLLPSQISNRLEIHALCLHFSPSSSSSLKYVRLIRIKYNH
mgnify:CR=1 FL=1